MSDLVERLRCSPLGFFTPDIYKEAADEIKRLGARIAELEEAIKKYAADSKIVNSTIIQRDGDTSIIHANFDTGVITIDVDGYVLMPMEQWQDQK